MRRSAALAASLFITLALGTACGGNGGGNNGGNNGGNDGGGIGGGAETTVRTIEISVSGATITPNGAEVDVDAGQPIDLVVTADAPGEIHVHSDPEQEFEYVGTGEPETFKLQIDRPGQVEVESHTLDKLIVKLVVQ